MTNPAFITAPIAVSPPVSPSSTTPSRIRLSRRRVPHVAAFAVALLASAATLVGAGGCAAAIPEKVTVAGHILGKEQVTHLIDDADAIFQRAVRAGGAAVNGSSRCFLTYATTNHSEAGDSLICGPVLMYGTARTDLWATMPVHVTDSGLPRPTTPEFPPKPRPAGLTLARPDGAQPDDGANLPAPRPPSDQPGDMKYISPADLVSVPMKAPAGDGLLLSPMLAAKIAAIGAAPAYGRGLGARSAANGEQFLFLQ
ncbi:hypothetical protein [Fodinicola acaciae]|uniref:hypothetical protein n=1 Tax=Fodinicola acaciae TaxID=2681555 RepID=UPI0013D22DA5|nr:hypothetical protein [Fodinicola acaciae]